MHQPTNRFFLVPEPVYMQVRSQLDAHWQHPNGRADTCMVPASEAVRDEHGTIICPVLRETCDWPEVAATIAQLLAAGIITETDEQTYFNAQPHNIEQ
jgi:hypothetical protein